MVSEEKEPWVVHRFYKDKVLELIGYNLPTSDYESWHSTHGFRPTNNGLLEPYFYTKDEGTEFLELLEYYHPENKIWMIHLWDYNGEVFEFCCTSYRERAECLKFIVDFAVQCAKYQKIIKDLKNETE